MVRPSAERSACSHPLRLQRATWRRGSGLRQQQGAPPRVACSLCPHHLYVHGSHSAPPARRLSFHLHVSCFCCTLSACNVA
jgi:hypothetical protein